MTAVTISSAGFGTVIDRISLFAGTFLVAFALLAFEINTVRTINFAVGPSLIYLAIALAMLGLSGASSLLSLFDIRTLPVRREILLFWLCVAIAALLVHAHFLAADQKAILNAVVAEAGRNDGLKGVLVAGIGYGLKTAFVVGLGLSLPYFLFGALLALLFTTTDAGLYGRLYASDLIGAAVGCVAAILVMETTDYALSVTVPAVVVLLAAAAYVWPARRMLAAAGILAAVALGLLPRADWYAERIEPPVNANYLARDYHYQENIREVWRDWNSYTRVGAVVWDGANARPYAMMSLANGDGMAWVWPYDPDAGKALSHLATRPAMLLDPPANALVMFAGAGADLMSLHQFGNGATRITGVELNAELVAGARGLDGYGVPELLGEPMIDLQIAEGRVFLERDTRRYDQILLSFSGATASYYAGALGGTTQFLFTYEGLEAIFGRLTRDGYAVILQVNKVNVIGALRRYLDEHRIDTDPARTIVVRQTERHDRVSLRCGGRRRRGHCRTEEAADGHRNCLAGVRPGSRGGGMVGRCPRRGTAGDLRGQTHGVAEGVRRFGSSDRSLGGGPVLVDRGRRRPRDDRPSARRRRGGVAGEVLRVWGRGVSASGARAGACRV